MAWNEQLRGPKRGPGAPLRRSPSFQPTPGPIAAYVSNANQPQFCDLAQYAGYAVIASIAMFAKSGAVGAAEYQFGTHAEATYNAEAIKQQFQRSVRTPPAAATGAVPKYTYAPAQIDPTQQSPQLNQPITPATAGLALIHWGEGQDYVDSAGYYAKPLNLTLATGYLGEFQQTLPQIEDRPTQQVWRAVTAGFTPRVPPYAFASQTDTTQLAAIYTDPPNAAVLTSGILGAFQSTADQPQDRPTVQVWRAVVAGNTPRIGAYSLALEPQTDLTRQPFTVVPSIGRPSQMAYQQAAPQQVDLTLPAQLQESLTAAPIVLGPTVRPFITPEQRFDTANYSVTWTLATFSNSGGIGPIPVDDDAHSGGRVLLPGRRIFLRNPMRGETEEEKRLRRIEQGIIQAEPASTQPIVAVRPKTDPTIKLTQQIQAAKRQADMYRARFDAAEARKVKSEAARQKKAADMAEMDAAIRQAQQEQEELEAQRRDAQEFEDVLFIAVNLQKLGLEGE